MYSCIVTVENPSLSKGYYANVAAGVPFEEIVNRIYSMLSVNMEDTGCDTLVEALPVSKNGRKEDFEAIYNNLGFDMEEEGGGEWVFTSREEGEFVLKEREIVKALVPNVKGMGLRDALYLLENSGLKVGVVGSGMVNKQSLTPGSRVRRGSYIQIELK